MGETIFGIDKGILKAFALMVLVVGSLTTFFLSEYISAILLGSIFQTTNVGENDTPAVIVSSDASTLLVNAEDDFVTTFTSVNTGIKFAAALITVVAVILVFASFLPKRGSKKESMDY